MVWTCVDLCVCVSATGTRPFTVKNVLEVVERVPANKWREWGETTQSVGAEESAESDGFDFRDALGIPANRMESIARKCPSLAGRVRAGITWWWKNYPQASWRKVLWALDAIQEDELADEIRCYAEPPKGYYICRHRVYQSPMSRMSDCAF